MTIPAFPYPPDPSYPPVTYPATNTTNITLQPKEKEYSAIIFDDIDDANDFMEGTVVGDVRFCEYGGTVFVTVFYEVVDEA